MEKASLGEILNLGSGKEYKVAEVVSLIEKISGQKLNVEWQHSEERVGDKAIRWLAETSKMNDILNWRPKYSLEKGLSTTYSWFRENLEKYEVTENSKLKKLSE